MRKLTLLLALVIATLAMAVAGAAFALSGNSGDANCANGGTTSAYPPGWQKNGFPNGNPWDNGGASNPQAAFYRCA